LDTKIGILNERSTAPFFRQGLWNGERLPGHGNRLKASGRFRNTSFTLPPGPFRIKEATFTKAKPFSGFSCCFCIQATSVAVFFYFPSISGKPVAKSASKKNDFP
jgi:hypothetical protein